ncbi:MAG: DNA-binding protein [Desulfobaccales bacterium]
MKKLLSVWSIVGIFMLLLTAGVWAQPAGPGPGGGGPGPGGGMGMGMGAGMHYDPKTVETIQGEVTQVQQMQGMAAGVHLQVKTAKETMMVVLGPASYLEQQKMKIAVGDKVEIKGSRVQHPQMALLIAGELKKGDQVVKLRDDQGKPLWSGQGPKRKTFRD